MCSMSIPLAFLAVASCLQSKPTDALPTTVQIRQTADRSISFLEKEGMVWMQKQQCASCHHLPMMVWALNEAKNAGLTINEEKLSRVTAWTLDANNRAEAFQELPLERNRTEPDYLGPLVMTLAIDSITGRDTAIEKQRQQLLTHSVGQQEADGSWDANRGGRQPVHGPKEVQTAWLILALTPRSLTQTSDDPWKKQRGQAVQWLANTPPGEQAQTIALRLLVANRLGKPLVDRQPLRDALLRLQQIDGGWSQTKEMKSDAYATGLALYVLAEFDEVPATEAIRRGQAFLVQTQRSDGSWLMTSRSAPPPGPGPARNLGPITYVGTAWATMGLVRTLPVKRD